MRRVYKYVLQPNDGPGVCTVPMPASAEVLHVNDQQGELCVWALVDITHAVADGRTFYVYGTGHDIEHPFPLRHVGSGLMYEGELVFHVFERVWS